MTLRELLTHINRLSDNDAILDRPAVIATVNPALGSRHFVEVTGFHVGFDWESGQPIFSTGTDQLLHVDHEKRPERVEVVDLLSDNRGTGTTLKLIHKGGFMGKNIHTNLAKGDKFFIAKAPKTPAIKEGSKK